jgi:hypothetical protein
LRPIDRPVTAWQWTDTPPTHWGIWRHSCALPPGVYELQVLTDPPYRDPHGRELGVGIARIAFSA